MPTTVVVPDAIFGPDGDELVSGPLDPCPMCGSRPHEAPEGVHDVHSVKHNPGTSVGDAKWNHGHCWKCGHRPGLNQVTSNRELARQFAAFKAWHDAQTEGALNVPGDTSLGALRAAMEHEANRGPEA